MERRLFEGGGTGGATILKMVAAIFASKESFFFKQFIAAAGCQLPLFARFI